MKVYTAGSRRRKSWRASKTGNEKRPSTTMGVAAMKTPRATHSTHQPLVEVGIWTAKHLHRNRQMAFVPWAAAVESSQATKPLRLKVDPLALARRYQDLLDSGTAKNRAHLASYLGVSRARVTQVLRRLDPAEVTTENCRPTVGT